MENIQRKKIIQEMEKLKLKTIESITASLELKGEELNKEKIGEQITIKYLGKISLTNEQGEIVDKDWYAVVEQIGEQIEITYYAENETYLGHQTGIDGRIQSMWEMPQEMKNLNKEDLEKAKTLEKLQEEQKEQENEKKEDEKQEEPQKLPGIEEPQLTKRQVDILKGPKTSLTQIVDQQTIGNIIGLEGQYMQIVDVDVVKQLIPDLQIPTNQRTIPIEILPDGSANIIGEDKLQFSRQEGINSTNENITATNEGLLRNEQNIETYNIVSKGGMHTIAVGYDENGGTPLEMKYGWRDISEPNKIAYSELETVHEGPLVQDDDTNQFKQDATEGIDKPNTISQEDVEKYARAKGLYEFDSNGNVVGYDLDTAKQEITEDGREVDKIIEDLDVKTKEPDMPKSFYE